MAPAIFQVVSDDNLINGNIKALRLWKRTSIKFPKDMDTPPEDLFDASSGDKEEAKSRNMRPLLSAWLLSLPEHDIRRVFEGIKIDEQIGVYKFDSSDINSIFSGDENFIKVGLFLDPLEVGSLHYDLHCAIQGACKGEGEAKENSKAHYKNIKHELRSRSVYHKTL